LNEDSPDKILEVNQMLKLAKLVSPSNYRYAKSPYASSTKNTRDTTLLDRPRAEAFSFEAGLNTSLYCTTRKIQSHKPQENKKSRSRSNEYQKQKNTPKSIPHPMLEPRKLRSSKRNYESKERLKKVVHSDNTSEIDVFLQDILSVSLDERRNLELLFVLKWHNEPSEIKYLISGNWMHQYMSFLSGERSKPPREIDNAYLKEIPLAKNTTIYMVNDVIWSFLHILYQGGPEIPIKKNEKNKMILLKQRKGSNLLILTDEKPLIESQNLAPITLINNLKNLPYRKRREEEHKFIKTHMNTKTRLNYFIDEDWIDTYLQYLNGNRLTPPRAIDNKKLKELLENRLYHGECYSFNEIIWNFLSNLYGASPEIAIRELNLEPGRDSDLLDLGLLLDEINEKREKRRLESPQEKIPLGRLSSTTKLLLGLPEKQESKLSKEKCIVCTKEIADTIFIPCRHRCCCYPDAQQIIQNKMRCPVCSKFIEGFMKSLKVDTNC